MKKLSVHLAIMFLMGSVSLAQAAQFALADWCVNVNGDTATACNGAGSGSGSISLSSFNTTLEPGSNTLGSITVTLSGGAGQVVSFYADYDVDFATNGSFTDSASVHGALPAGMSYELDDPNTSNIFSDFAANTLNNANNVLTPSGPPNTCCDVSVALSLGLDVPAGGSQTVTFQVTDTAPTSGFYIQQTNENTHNSIYLQEFPGTPTMTTIMPEPSTLSLGFILAGSLFILNRRRSR